MTAMTPGRWQRNAARLPLPSASARQAADPRRARHGRAAALIWTADHPDEVAELLYEAPVMLGSVLRQVFPCAASDGPRIDVVVDSALAPGVRND